MAEIVLVEATSHSPYLYSEPEWWAENRARRPVRADVPVDSPEVNAAKYAQCMDDFGRLRQQVEAARPDVLLIFGDDQLEQFSFNNFPAFGIYMGEEVYGNHPKTIGRRVVHGENVENPEQVYAKGHPQLGKQLMESLIQREFDVAFALDRPNKERGIGHAFVNPSLYINPAYDIPILPFWVNCYYAPQPTGMRCYRLGKAVREAIEAMPGDLRVAVIASGGLWHTPGSQDAYLDEEFDMAMINAVKSGDAREMAEYFDSFPWDYPSERPEKGPDRAAWTGMTGGVGSGAGETRNWLITAAIMEGKPADWADYVPVYASPCGMGFAYWAP
jgi:hypothetical protein